MNKIKFVLAIFTLITILSCGICSSTKNLSDGYQIKYKVTGSANTVSITLSNKDGGTEQFSNVSLPYEYSFKGSGSVYISAQNNGKSGSVTVEIYKDGKVIKSSSSSGEYVIASANDYIW